MLRNRLYRYGNENGRVPAHLNFAKQVFDNMVKNKDITALINADTEEQMSYGELAQMTVDVALSLKRMGVGKGEVVCICSEKILEYLPTVMGIICTGATFSPTDPTYGSFPLLHRVKIVRPRIMFCSLSAYKTHKATFDEVGSIQHYILYGNEKKDGTVLFKNFLTETAKIDDFLPLPVNGWEDMAFIVYSSGTTGLPKGVPITHLGALLNSRNIVTDDYIGESIYNSREFYYSYGLMYALACLRVGATIVYSPGGGTQAMLEAIQKYKIKLVQVAPMIIMEMIKSSILENYDVSTLQYILSSSTYIREEAVKAIKQRLPNLVSVIQLYGMSEGGSICNDLDCPTEYRAGSCGLPGYGFVIKLYGMSEGGSICNELDYPTESRPGSSGVPGYGFVIKVVDLQTREPLGPNQRGEICIKGPSVMKAYINNVNPDCKDEEGFLKTGDVGYYDDDGYFYIVNRIKDLIKCNDMSIAPAEYEELLQQHPSVREAGVVGKPHPKHGEVPVAFIVLQPGCSATEEELVQQVGITCRMRLAGGVRFIDRLPRGAGDKLDRKELMTRLR